MRYYKFDINGIIHAESIDDAKRRLDDPLMNSGEAIQWTTKTYYREKEDKKKSRDYMGENEFPDIY